MIRTYFWSHFIDAVKFFVASTLFFNWVSLLGWAVHRRWVWLDTWMLRAYEEKNITAFSLCFLSVIFSVMYLILDYRELFKIGGVLLKVDKDAK